MKGKNIHFLVQNNFSEKENNIPKKEAKAITHMNIGFELKKLEICYTNMKCSNLLK